MSSILDLDAEQAREFFLRQESYCNFDLPKYFDFNELIGAVEEKLKGKNLSDFHATNDIGKSDQPAFYEDVSFSLIGNKDGQYAWRPFKLIHPALYVSLVDLITCPDSWGILKSRFQDYRSCSKIKCMSIPVIAEEGDTDKGVTITNWWKSVEQQSIALALDYRYVVHTDVSDCYGSMYTHSVPWAIHTKDVAKSKPHDKNLLGNRLDTCLRGMSHGQTNGIPQGSILMDFIAEIILGYADEMLAVHLEWVPVHVIRYRDDYRIFANNPQDAENVTKVLSEILIGLGLRLNPHKSFTSDRVIESSVKSDKLYWLGVKNSAKSLVKHLLLIHQLGEKFPNSGSLQTALTKFYRRLYRVKDTDEVMAVLLSIVADIAFKNPRTYPISSAIISKLLSLMPAEKVKGAINKLIKRFALLPNNGHLEIWLQRATIKYCPDLDFQNSLCKKVNGASLKIWNSDWLVDSIKSIVDSTKIVNEDVVQEIDSVVEKEEVDLFGASYGSEG